MAFFIKFFYLNMPQKYHEKLAQEAMGYNYFIFPVQTITQVDNERRRFLKISNLRYVSMVNYNDIYLLIFKQKKLL